MRSRSTETKYPQHVRHGVLHAEEVGIQVAVGDPEADLAGQSGIELVLGDRLQQGVALVRRARIGVPCHVHRLGGHRDLVNLLPGPAEVGTARHDHLDLRAGVALALAANQRLRQRVIERREIAHADSAAKHRLHRPFILVNRVETGGDVAQHEPDDNTGDTSCKYGHRRSSSIGRPVVPIWLAVAVA
jgi:hypothetical protein